LSRRLVRQDLSETQGAGEQTPPGDKLGTRFPLGAYLFHRSLAIMAFAQGTLTTERTEVRESPFLETSKEKE